MPWINRQEEHLCEQPKDTYWLADGSTWQCGECEQVWELDSYYTVPVKQHAWNRVAAD